MRVLGLDPGSRKTGYGVVERAGNTFRSLHHGHISPPARASLAERLLAISRRAGEVMDRFSPDCVVIEEAFYHESVRSTLVLGHVRGALILTALERGLDVAEYTPREVKLSVAGTGAAAKEQVAFMVRRILGLAGALQSDAADALAVALCHHHRQHRSAPARAARVAARNLAALLEQRVASGPPARWRATPGSAGPTLRAGERVIGRKVRPR
jgi:crossover junction endodeoxyribonuclease RuvC